MTDSCEILVPFQVVVGNYGMSPNQEKVQFAMWAILASPLLMSVDIRNIREQSRLLLQNPRVLSINQDPLGIQGKRIVNVCSHQYYTHVTYTRKSQEFQNKI